MVLSLTAKHKCKQTLISLMCKRAILFGLSHTTAAISNPGDQEYYPCTPTPMPKSQDHCHGCLSTYSTVVTSSHHTAARFGRAHPYTSCQPGIPHTSPLLYLSHLPLPSASPICGVHLSWPVAIQFYWAYTRCTCTVLTASHPTSDTICRKGEQSHHSAVNRLPLG